MSNFGQLPDFDPDEDRGVPRSGTGLTVLGIAMLVLGAAFAYSPIPTMGNMAPLGLIFTLPLGGGTAFAGLVIATRGVSQIIDSRDQ